MTEEKIQRHDWRDIFCAFKMAFDPKRMFLGYAAILASLIWCIAATAVFSSLKLFNVTPSVFINLVLSPAKEGLPVIFRNIVSAAVPFNIGEFFAFTVIAFGLLAIWSFAGGAITRIASLDYAIDQSVRLIDVLKFSRKKFWSYFWSPLVPVIGVLFFALCNVAVGFIGRVPVFGEILIALSFPLILISGFSLAFIGIVGVLGLCFMLPTISAEGSDAFDAMGRAYSYVLSRPKKFILYSSINILYGIACLMLVAFVAWLMIRLSFYTLGLGMGQKFAMAESHILQRCSIACLGFCSMHSYEGTMPASSLNWSLQFLSYVLIAYIFSIKLAVWTFVATYLFSAKTIIYFLLRQEVDSTVVNDVYLEEEEKPLQTKGENSKENQSSEAGSKP
ncbi:MAG: hypothetical protein ACUBOA_02605 [Candidatus Loosdrechtia sp.]|uniref:hypothetical protein n=1 Tax=Candidatus Loosdrechtia sp. TaxID=3101272 RepID=UPI003A6FBB87|nr:MAG: hypothetical protein QY305_02000 [Candidatus Jettenia sp. AMX2]